MIEQEQERDFAEEVQVALRGDKDEQLRDLLRLSAMIFRQALAGAEIDHVFLEHLLADIESAL